MLGWETAISGSWLQKSVHELPGDFHRVQVYFRASGGVIWEGSLGPAGGQKTAAQRREALERCGRSERRRLRRRGRTGRRACASAVYVVEPKGPGVIELSATRSAIELLTELKWKMRPGYCPLECGCSGGHSIVAIERPESQRSGLHQPER